MKPGEYKQIPDKPGFAVIGFYIACPFCGYRCITVLADDHGAREENGKLCVDSFVKCLKCKKKGRVVSGEFIAS